MPCPDIAREGRWRALRGAICPEEAQGVCLGSLGRLVRR